MLTFWCIWRCQRLFRVLSKAFLNNIRKGYLNDKLVHKLTNGGSLVPGVECRDCGMSQVNSTFLNLVPSVRIYSSLPTILVVTLEVIKAMPCWLILTTGHAWNKIWAITISLGARNASGTKVLTVFKGDRSSEFWLKIRVYFQIEITYMCVHLSYSHHLSHHYKGFTCTCSLLLY